MQNNLYPYQNLTNSSYETMINTSNFSMRALTLLFLVSCSLVQIPSTLSAELVKVSSAELKRDYNTMEQLLTHSEVVIDEALVSFKAGAYNLSYEEVMVGMSHLEKCRALSKAYPEKLGRGPTGWLSSVPKLSEEHRANIMPSMNELDRKLNGLMRDLKPKLAEIGANAMDLESLKDMIAQVQSLIEIIKVDDPEKAAKLEALLEQLYDCLERKDKACVEAIWKQIYALTDGKVVKPSTEEPKPTPNDPKPTPNDPTPTPIDPTPTPTDPTPTPDPDIPPALRPDIKKISGIPIDEQVVVLNPLLPILTDPQDKADLASYISCIEKATTAAAREECLKELARTNPKLAQIVVDALNGKPVNINGVLYTFDEDGNVTIYGSLNQAIVDRKYIRGEGNKLVAETKKMAVREDGEYKEKLVEERKWRLNLREDSSASKYVPDEGFAKVYSLQDANGKESFTITGWSVSQVGGSFKEAAGADAELKVTFPASGTYEIKVSGKTDWDSPFNISSQVPIQLPGLN